MNEFNANYWPLKNNYIREVSTDSPCHIGFFSIWEKIAENTYPTKYYKPFRRNLTGSNRNIQRQKASKINLNFIYKNIALDLLVLAQVQKIQKCQNIPRTFVRRSL
jgi:hypothetical protein